MKNFWQILCLASFFGPSIAWASVPVQTVVIGEEDIVSLRNDEHPEFVLMQGAIPDHQELFEVIDCIEGEDEGTHIPLWEIIVHYKRSSNAPSNIDLDDLLVEYVFHIIIADRADLPQLEENANSDS
jgi:hypothetical protein